MANKKFLMVEGVDDEHVLKHLCGNRGVPNLDNVKQYEGVDNLLAAFPEELKGTDIVTLGVVVDADMNLNARWQTLRNDLSKKGYPNVPTDPNPDGTILDPPDDTLLPRVGVWIMPDNQTNGTLEDFLRFLVPEGSMLFKHVESSIATIPKGEQRFNDPAKPKAIIHTWLAWQEEPGKPYGTAITARFLDPDVPQVDILVSWLNRLFFPGKKLPRAT